MASASKKVATKVSSQYLSYRSYGLYLQAMNVVMHM